MKIFLIGYMASGKTTFGKALANKLDIPFIDLDDYIEEKEGRTITEIFSQEGDKGFRKLEKEWLRKAVEEEENLILACGGGTPCHSDNMDFLNKKGITVFIEASTPVLISRLQEENSSRPILAGKSDDEIREKVLTQLCERLPHYMEAKMKWHGDDLESQEQIDANVESFVSTYPSLFHSL